MQSVASFIDVRWVATSSCLQGMAAGHPLLPLRGRVSQGVGAAKPYLRLQENCWALTVHPDGEWRVSYDL